LVQARGVISDEKKQKKELEDAARYTKSKPHRTAKGAKPPPEQSKSPGENTSTGNKRTPRHQNPRKINPTPEKTIYNDTAKNRNKNRKPAQGSYHASAPGRDPTSPPIKKKNPSAKLTNAITNPHKRPSQGLKRRNTIVFIPRSTVTADIGSGRRKNESPMSLHYRVIG